MVLQGCLQAGGLAGRRGREGRGGGASARSGTCGAGPPAHKNEHRLAALTACCLVITLLLISLTHSLVLRCRTYEVCWGRNAGQLVGGIWEQGGGVLLQLLLVLLPCCCCPAAAAAAAAATAAVYAS